MSYVPGKPFVNQKFVNQAFFLHRLTLYKGRYVPAHAPRMSHNARKIHCTKCTYDILKTLICIIIDNANTYST